MKRCAALLLLTLALAAPLRAQEFESNAVAAGVRSTEVAADGRVTFRVFAPNAGAVSLNGDWVAQGRGTAGAMKKADNGVWSLTVGPLPPDFYGYSFRVDGLSMPDPKNVRLKTGVSSLESIVEVPGAANDYQAAKDVPHGEVREAWYTSGTLGGELRRAHIYTPPGYNTGHDTYPVLYLINGGGDEDSAWTSAGRANWILDNLIAAHKAKPMIVVMPNGATSVPGVVPSMMADRTTPEGIRNRTAALARLHDAFVADLLTNLLPYVEKNYRVDARASSRAVAGLSMGGAETLRTGVGHYPLFGGIGIFSMGAQPGCNGPFLPDFEERNAAFFKDPAATNRNVKVIYIGVGRDDKTVCGGPKNLADGLQRHGIHYEFHETDGGHTWLNWRPYLYEFAQRIFQ